MGVNDWLQQKGEEKSASNIIDGLRRLVAAVRTDINETTNELAGRTAAMDAMVDGTQPWEADTFAQFEQDRKRWSNRKAKVVEAQKNLFDDLALWSSLPVERTLNEVVVPALTSGNLVALSEQSYGAVVVAAYRVCEAVARQKGVSLEDHTPHAILQLVTGAGDPQIARFTPSAGTQAAMSLPRVVPVSYPKQAPDEDRALIDRAAYDINFLKALKVLAEEGTAAAQHNLGVTYFKGRGVQQDYVEAMIWFRKAAEQNYAEAQFNVGVMYENGRGVPQDYVQAHQWFNLAAARFPASETESRARVVKSRDRIASKMTPAQVAEAQRLAREWKPK